MRRYITFKVGQNRDHIQNSGQFSVLEDLVIFQRQAVKIRDCPGKIGTNGHLSYRLHCCQLEYHTAPTTIIHYYSLTNVKFQMYFFLNRADLFLILKGSLSVNVFLLFLLPYEILIKKSNKLWYEAQPNPPPPDFLTPVV